MKIMGAIKTLLSFEDFERMEDEHEGKTGLLEGELFHLPPPFIKHTRATRQPFPQLRQQLEHCKKANPDVPAGKAFSETQYLLGRSPGSWIVPDVSVTGGEQRGGDYWEGAPRIAIEIVSESNGPAYVARKQRKYLECGTAEVWISHPDTRHAIVHTKTGQRRGEPAFRTGFLPGIEDPFAELLD
jgi:Uma2 family endonuclease